MANISKSLVEYFSRTASRDAQLLAEIESESAFQMNAELWRFTLIDLYSFFQRIDSDFQDIEYNKFRKILYNSPINQEVRKFGAEILVDTNKGKGHVDHSTYILIWH